MTSAVEDREPILNDEMMSWYQKRRYIYDARRRSEFEQALDTVIEKGYTEFTETTGIVRSGSILRDQVKIVSFEFAHPSRNAEAAISVAYFDNGDVQFGIGIQEMGNRTNTQSKSSTTNVIVNGERYVVEKDSIKSTNNIDGRYGPELTIDTASAGPCSGLGYQALTASGNDICYAIAGGLLITGGIVSILSPIPGDEAVAGKIALSEITAAGTCFLAETARREAEERGIECDNLKFYICVKPSLIPWVTPTISAVPKCVDD